MKTLIIAAVAMIILTACGDRKLTRSNYNLIDVGMRYSEVTNILGEPTWCDDMQRPNECMWGKEEKHIKVYFISRRVINTESRGI
ncbi:MAG: DUF3862 domain-containing protein [Idiomarina sp.]|nr:DUF3862 domain-containing protein [Idiomarina sp.]